MSAEKPLTWHEAIAGDSEVTFIFNDDDCMIPVRVEREGVPHTRHPNGGWAPLDGHSD